MHRAAVPGRETLCGQDERATWACNALPGITMQGRARVLVAGSWPLATTYAGATLHTRSGTPAPDRDDVMHDIHAPRHRRRRFSAELITGTLAHEHIPFSQ